MSKIEFDLNVANGIAISVANDELPVLVDGGIPFTFYPLKITVTCRYIQRSFYSIGYAVLESDIINNIDYTRGHG